MNQQQLFEFLRPFRYLWMPILLVLGIYYALPLIDSVPPHWAHLFPWLPTALLLPVLFLSWRFHYHRAAATALILWLLHQWLFRAQQPSLAQHLLLGLIPLNLALLAYLSDRSLLSRACAGWLLLGFVQVGLGWLLIQKHPATLEHWLNLQPPALALLPFSLPYPFSVLLAQLAAGLLLLGAWLRYLERFDSYLLMTTLLACWLLIYPAAPAALHLLTSAGLLLWLIALVTHSHELAYLDELTGLPGRRALNLRLQSLGRRYSAAMVDIDHFKQFNDRYGHDVGDQVLKLVAARLAEVRPGRAYRYGGEEFCILFPRKTREQVLPVLEALRTRIESSGLTLRHPQRPKTHAQGKKLRGRAKELSTKVNVTVSIGVAEHQAGEDTLKQADQALYQAKAGGRNRIC